MTIRILIADDHPVFRFGLKALIEAEPDCEIVAEASTGEEVIELARAVDPDIILMDITMPGVNGIEATREILESDPDVGILIVTMADDSSLYPALRAGARGYLLKGAEGEETLRAIRAVANGEMIFSGPIADRLAGFFRESEPASKEVFPELTPREHEVLDLMAQGLTNSSIAERLSLSPKTVRNQVSTVFSKLGVEDRSEAIVTAREAGLGR